MGTTQTTGSAVAAHDRRRVDVTDLRTEGVAAYARHQPGTELHLERRGARTYLVTRER